MAESLITLGIGSAPTYPAEFILVGLHPNAVVVAPMTPSTITGTGSAGTVSGSGSGIAGMGDYDVSHGYDGSVDWDRGAPDGVARSGSAGTITQSGEV